MRIKEYVAKKQGMLDSGRDVVVGVRGGGARQAPLVLTTPP